MSTPRSCDRHASRAATLRVLWADGRGVWYSCGMRCVEAWHAGQAHPEVVSIRRTGEPRVEELRGSGARRLERRRAQRMLAGGAAPEPG